MASMPNSACKSLLSSGLRSVDAYPILNEVQRWLHSNGPEWTIKRLKVIKQAYVNKLAGKTELFPQDSWVKHNKNGPKGPFKFIFKLKNPAKAISSLMVYTSFISNKVTDQQKKKFYGAVNRRPTKPNLGAIMSQFTRCIDDLIIPISRQPQRESFSLTKIIQKNTRVPFVDEVWDRDERDYVTVIRTVPMSLEAVKASFIHPLIHDWCNAKQGEGTLDERMYKLWADAALNPEGETDYVGVIGHIQEPGFKLRAVANPFPSLQMALEPMGKLLYNALRNIPQDATFDQDRAVQEIQQYMIDGGELVAFDLSNATDRFPLSVTLDVLSRFKIDPLDLDLFVKVSRGKWFDKEAPDNTTQWKVGQPLGVYPSFAAFALSHHAMVMAAVNRGQSPLPFYRVLGDDIVIDKEYAPQLKAIYDLIEVDISMDKSIDSPILTEFGGRLITKTRIIPQPKMRDLSDRSFLDLMRNLGPTAMGFLPKRQRAVIKMFSEVPSDLHPYGMGWNPKGKTYDERVEASKDILECYNSEKSVNATPSLSKSGFKRLKEAILLRMKQHDIELQHQWKEQIGLRPKSSPHSEDSSNKCISSLTVTSSEMDGLDLSLLNQQIADLNESVLTNQHLTKVEFGEDEIPSSWEQDEDSLVSDPRGVSVLEQVEKRYAKPLRSRRNK